MRVRENQKDASVCGSVHQKQGALRFSFELSSNCASCAITAAVSHRVSIRAHRVYVSVSGARQAKKTCVRFSPTGRSRPCVNSWFPCCLCAGDAISTCGECTISRANTIVTPESRDLWKRDLQKTLLWRGNSTNAVPLYHTAYRMEHHQH